MNPWFALAVLSLSTFIGTQLIVYLDFPPALWLRDRVVGGWRPLTLKEGDRLRRSVAGLGPKVDWEWTDIEDVKHRHAVRDDRIPFFFAELLSCPWCVGAWVSLFLTTGTDLIVGIPLPALMWSAAWALGSLLASREWV